MNTPTHTFEHVDHLLATIDSHATVAEAPFAH